MAIEAATNRQRGLIVRIAALIHLEMTPFASSFEMACRMNEDGLDMSDRDDARVGNGDR